MTYTTQKDLRADFWAQHPQFKTRPGGHNRQSADARCAFSAWIDSLHRDGQISDALANRATLG